MTWSHPAFDSIAALLARRTGLSFSPPRQEGTEQGIRRAMRRAKVRDLDAYAKLLGTEDDAFDDLIVELTVGETYFFREPGQFAFLRREVLPELRARSADRVTGVRAWSAGCASGEEAYSLAMMLEFEGLLENASVLGTDISHVSLARARQATYTDWSLRGEGAAQARPYLIHQNAHWEVAQTIRRRVAFAHLNLALDVYPSLAIGVWGMDLILCRNVLIYFDADTITAVARRLFASLAPGGLLVLASSDPPVKQFAPFETVLAEEGVFYRRPASSWFPVSDRDVSPPADVPSMWKSPLVLPATDSTPVAAPSPADIAPGSLESPAPLPIAKVLAEASEAFARGEYARVIEQTSSLAEDPSASALRVRALANIDASAAERAAAEASSRHPLCAELHFLHGTLLLGAGKDADAARAVRRALYLDRSLATAHCTLGAILERSGDVAGARRAFRNARDICAARPADEEVPLSDGERAGRLNEAAGMRIALLDRNRPKGQEATR